MDYEKEYKGLVNELTRHFSPAGRMVVMRSFYRAGEAEPAIKLSESPFIYRALVAAGGIEGVDKNGFKTISVPPGQYCLLGHTEK